MKDPELFWYYVPKAGARVAYAKYTGKKLRSKRYAGQWVKSQQEGNDILTQWLESGKVFMFGRHGTNELNCGSKAFMLRKGIIDKIDLNRLERPCYNSGLYPVTTETMVRFQELLEMACQQTDMYGTFRMILEDYYIKKFMPKNVVLTHLNMMDFWRYEKPFTSALKGKRVVVVHPLADLIESQYKKRALLFENPYVLPEFELRTVKAIQTVAGERDSRAESWFDGLEYMYNAVMAEDFDVAILGCGSYGMPLAGMLKKQGKSVIYMGGVTQMLFGIKGRRWDLDPAACKLYNEHWVYPNEKDTPKDAKAVEGGCYW